MSQVRPYRPHLSSLSECELQDIDEVWFPGSHADVGGGWNPDENEEWPISHVPLAWMVCEAQRAGLRFDPNKLKRFGCQGEPLSDEPSGETNDDRPAQSTFESVIWSAITHGKLHDSLKYGSLPWRTVLPWKTLEWLPFRRMRMLPDESWKPVRLPPPLGEWRDIPRDAKIHVSALHRMTVDPTYQPANLCRRDNKSRLISKDGCVRWRMCDYSGSIVDKTYRRIYD